MVVIKTDEKIIRAALDEIKIKSVLFTMDDLTRRLHISKTSLYNAAGSKENLIHAIISYVMNEFDRGEKSIQDADISSTEKISRFIDQYSELFSTLEHGVYDDLKINYPAEWQRCEEFRRSKVDVLLKFIEDCIRREVFRPVNLAVVRRLLMFMSSILSDSKFLAENNLTYTQAIAALRELMLNGFVKR